MRLTDEEADRAPNCPTPEWYDRLAVTLYGEHAVCSECGESVDLETWKAWREKALNDPEPQPLMHRECPEPTD